MNFPKFSKKNTSFVCKNCQKEVPPASQTCRDHCPYCLYSMHVDINPGDRQNECKGLMRPTGYERHKKKGWMILYCCEKCGENHRNIANLEDPVAPDDYDVLLSLSLVDKGL